MSINVTPALRQRADYTHKFNTKTGRHGWLRLTPAYSLRIVEELIAPTDMRLRVLDPFCGTSTTALSAAYHGHHAVTTDINPFLVWFGRAKIATYSHEQLSEAADVTDSILSDLKVGRLTPRELPSIYNIERWWSPKCLHFLCCIQNEIDRRYAHDKPVGDLLRVAFCRTLISCSSASFNHQSMSFRDVDQLELELEPDLEGAFRDHVQFVLHGAASNPVGQAEVHMHDARDLAHLDRGFFDLVVTSPPYANRMSYIRELRPYMYWLRFLTNGRDAGELDWAAIGGTWGIATSRLSEWKASEGDEMTQEVSGILSRIADSKNPNGALLATYVHKYCADMRRHFSSLVTVLASGAKVHYIVGNSKFYGELVPVERIYAHFLNESGFTEVFVRPIRKRNSKKELVEFDVSARWP